MKKNNVLAQKNPMRMCIATRKKLPKKEMLRIISKEGHFLEYDLTGKKSGRGANLSMEKDALELAIKICAFDRAFNRKITDEEIKYLRENFDEVVSEKRFRSSPNQKIKLRIKKDELDNSLT